MCLFVWVYHNYCLCLWPLRASVVVIALGERNAGPTLRTWGTWVDVRGLTESKGLSLARHKHLPTVSAVSVTVYWKTRALVETLDLRGTPSILPRPWAFCYMFRVCFRLRSCWNHVASLTIFLLYSFFLPCRPRVSDTVPNARQQQVGPKCEVKACEEY